MKVTSVRHAWPEKKGFNLIRPHGLNNYSFLHFWRPVFMLINGEKVLTKPNAVVIFDKNTPQHLHSPDVDVMHDWFHVEGDEIPSLLSEAGIETNKLYYPKNCSFITDIIQSIEGEFLGAEKDSEKIIENLIENLITLLGRRVESNEEEYSVDYQTQMDFNALRNRIFSNLDKNWTILHMAEQVNLSESRFYVLYKAIFKTTPNQDLILARMEYAKRILSQNASASVFDVALECGYSNEFHFIRQFKKHVGVTPKKYALLYRNL
jgi:AraC family transcriptional regulator of arabinose operon